MERQIERTAQSKSRARPPATPAEEQIRWKKERKRRKRGSHNPQVDLRSVSLEAQTQEPRSSFGSSTPWTGSWTNSEPSTTSEQASHFDPLDKVKIARARELDKMEEQDDVFSGTPPEDSSHDPLCCDPETGRTNRRKLIARYGVSVAFFHAIATGKIAVVPPKHLDYSPSCGFESDDHRNA